MNEVPKNEQGLESPGDSLENTTDPGFLDRLLAKRIELTILGLSVVMILILLVLAFNYINGLATFSQTSRYYEEDWHDLLRYLWVIVGICSITIIILMRRDGFIATIAVLVIGTLVADNEWILESIAIARGENLEVVRQSRRLTEENNYEDNVSQLSQDILESLRRNATLSDKLDSDVFQRVIEKVLNQSEARWHSEVVEREGLSRLFLAIANRGETTFSEYLNQHKSDPRFLEDMGLMRDLGLVSFNWNYTENTTLTAKGRRLMVLMDNQARFPTELQQLDLGDSATSKFVRESNYGNWLWVDLTDQGEAKRYLFTAHSFDADPRISLYKPNDSLIRELQEESDSVSLRIPSSRLEFLAGNDDGGTGLNAEIALELAPGLYLARVESLNARVGSFELYTSLQNDAQLKMGKDSIVRLDSNNSFRHRFTVSLPPGVHRIGAAGPEGSEVDTYLSAYYDDELLEIYDYNDDSAQGLDAELVIGNCYNPGETLYHMLLNDINSVGGDVTLTLSSTLDYESTDDCLMEYDDMAYGQYESDENWLPQTLAEDAEYIGLNQTKPLDFEQSDIQSVNFSVDASGIYEFRIEGSSVLDGSLFVSITNEYFDEYWFDFYTDIDSTSTVYRAPLPAGNYGIYIQEDSDVGVPVSVGVVASDIDANWSLGDQNSLQETISLGADKGYFHFARLEITQRGLYEVRTYEGSDYGADPYVALYDGLDPSSQVIAYDDDSAGDLNASFTVDLAPGTYYLVTEDLASANEEIRVEIQTVEEQ